MVSRTKRVLFAGAAALGIGALALGGTAAQASRSAAPARPQAGVTITGAGSTFIAPLLNGGWVPGYTKAHPNVQIAYNPTGSGAGISLWSKGDVDFAGSDALLSPAQQAVAQGRCSGGVAKIPATIGAVALIYNLPGVNTGLKLTPSIVAAIFSGGITSWNDPQIQRLNSNVRLPQLQIQTVHRADGSGTTYIFTHYLAAVSASWKSTIGAGATVKWPNGTGAAKSSGVSAAVGRTQGAISYVDLAYAVGNNLNYAYIQNRSGQFIAPSVTSASLAANDFVKSIPSDLAQIIVDAPGRKSYPVTGYSYIFLCTHQSGLHGQTLVDFVRYAVTTGQSFAAARFYAPLPKSVQSKDLDLLNSLRG